MYVGNVTTPTLLMTGERDLRTPMEQTEQYYRALKLRKVPTAMIRLTDSWHSRNLPPTNFLRVQLYLRSWFERFMAAGRHSHRPGGMSAGCVPDRPMRFPPGGSHRRPHHRGDTGAPFGKATDNVLTRLGVEGFKNLDRIDVRLGPFTCVAGPNGVGKSNLFDAISFLAALADKPLVEAASTVRGGGGRPTR